MPQCLNCNINFPNRQVVDGKIRNFQRRKFCINCSPFNSHNTKDITKIPNKKSKPVIDWRKRSKIKAVEYKGGKCQICNYDKCITALEFHHLDPSQKDFSISGITRSWDKIKQEIEKCILVCSNCHREIHAGLIEADRVGLEPTVSFDA